MQPNEEIMNFLKENPTFYLATVDGYLPRVRPIGFAMWYNGYLCIALGNQFHIGMHRSFHFLTLVQL